MPSQALEPKTPRRAANKSAASRASAASGWSHTAATSTLVWMAVSLPLIAWDAGYVLGRPATMPGGNLHWPLWTPYKLYGEVDHMYGFKQWNAGNGFTAAQTILNVIETAMYFVYLWVLYQNGKSTPSGRAISGRAGATALLFGFSAAVMTLSKTLLYCKSIAPAPRGDARVLPGKPGLLTALSLLSQGSTSTFRLLTTSATTPPLISCSSGLSPSKLPTSAFSFPVKPCAPS